MVAETLQRPTGSLTAPMTSNQWTAPLLLRSSGSLLTLGRLPCPLLLGMPRPSLLEPYYPLTVETGAACQPGLPTIGFSLLNTTWHAPLTQSVPWQLCNSGCSLSACCVGEPCRDSAWAPLCLFWRLLHARWHPYFTDECPKQHGERMQERWCHQRRGVRTARVSFWAGGVPSHSESKDILRSGAMCARLLWSLGCCFSLQCLGWIWFWCLAQLDRRVLLPRLTLSCMIKPQPTSHLLTFS